MVSHAGKKEYPRPALTADVVVLALDAGAADHAALQILLIRRAGEPFRGRWALPGGFCEPTESVEQAATRELREETGLSGVRVEQVRAFTAPGRDPRGWVVSVAHLALVPARRLAEVAAGDDAHEAGWGRVRRGSGGAPRVISPAGDEAGPLAFDHDAILAAALAHLRRDADALAAELLGDPLTLPDLARAHAAARGEAPEPPEALGARLAAAGLIHPAPDPGAPGGPWFVADRRGA